MEDMNDVFNQLWIEKYRPKTIDDIVLNDEQKMFFKKCIAKEEIPHVLFVGPPGSGKTTLARILISELVNSEMDIISLNGSDSTGVDVVRDTIVSFLKTPPLNGRFKYVWIDEFDYMSQNAMAALRNTMETYASNGRFILTANYEYKIIDPILSRVTSFEMKTMPKDFVVNFAQKILSSENVEFDKGAVENVVNGLLPDVRKIVNTLQKHVKDGKLVAVKAEDLISAENKIVGLILELCDSMGTTNCQATCNKIPSTIQTVLNGKEVPQISKIYDCLFNNDKLPAWAKIKVNKYANISSGAFNQNFNFMAMVYEIIVTGLQYVKLFGIKK